MGWKGLTGGILTVFAWLSIGSAVACALWIVVDEIRHPQKMAVMNVVWPVTALYFSVLAVWAYHRIGRPKAKSGHEEGHHAGGKEKESEKSPTPADVAVGTSHCGAGCTLADLACEFWLAGTAITLLGSHLLAEAAIDFAAAWALGIVFQYFAIKPMRNLTAGEAIVDAIKADTLSIVAFQVGMYACMIAVRWLIPGAHALTALDARYWLMMQAAMICGFAASFPVNWWLLKIGLKAAM